MRSLWVFLLSVGAATACIGRPANFTAHGKLKCGREPLKDAQVSFLLIDRYEGYSSRKDAPKISNMRTLAKTKSDKEGRYELSAKNVMTEQEDHVMFVVLRFKHNCRHSHHDVSFEVDSVRVPTCLVTNGCLNTCGKTEREKPFEYSVDFKNLTMF